MTEECTELIFTKGSQANGAEMGDREEHGAMRPELGNVEERRGEERRGEDDEGSHDQ